MVDVGPVGPVDPATGREPDPPRCWCQEVTVPTAAGWRLCQAGHETPPDRDPPADRDRLVCRRCGDTGHVCENHPGLPWEPVAGRGCGCGAGMPCPECCTPVPGDGTRPIGDAFTPDHLRPPAGGGGG